MENKVAIIGLSCKFPGANNADEFWRNLCEGKESISFLSDEEMLAEGIGSQNFNKPNYVKAASVLDQAEGFDASFFYLSSKEAEKMDPQLRVFLETSWRALESSGYNSERFSGNIGVFASSLMSTYLLNNLYTSKDNYGGDIDALISDISGRMGNDTNYLATRTSYHLNLTGPSISVQTACSSSLVAVHMACQSVLNGECDIALAGGVALRFPMKSGYFYEQDGILSKDGHCRAFDADASGTIFGNGVGVVVLKRYEDALKDNDTIHAVVIGSAVNNDGSNKVGYSAPSENGLIQVLSEAINVSEITPDSISYIEAHGTGTIMGDPIEFAALNKVFTSYGVRSNTCALGSVKTNIGHLSVAAGIAGLIKVILMLQGKKIPSTLNYNNPNPNCDFHNSPFYINTELKDWGSVSGSLRRAGVTSMGMGGTNVHMLLEEFIQVSNEQKDSIEDGKSHVIPISAKSPEALSDASKNLIEYLNSNPHVSIDDISYTYAIGRRVFNYRLLCTVKDLVELKDNLEKNDSNTVLYQHGQPKQKPLVFMFPGQGSQYLNMGADCYLHEPFFREIFDYCSIVLESNLGFSLSKAMFEKASIDINQTKYTQLALFSLEYSLARLLIEWGIKPAAMIGHSIGEYVAACLAGVFTLEDALKIVLKRGELMESMPKGKMIGISAGQGIVSEIIGNRADIAAINESSVCVVAGEEEIISKISGELSEEGLPFRPVNTSHAFHCRMMQPIVKLFVEYVQQFSLKKPQKAFVSNVTGDWITDEMATNPSYWGEHIISTVNFSKGADMLLHNIDNIFVEVGPGTTLASYIRRNPNKDRGRLVLTSIGKTIHGKLENKELKKLMGRIWLEGMDVEWETYFQSDKKRKRLSLPTYPFQHEKFLALRDNSYSNNFNKPQAVKLDLKDWLFTPVWKNLEYSSKAIEFDKEQNILIFINGSLYSTELLKFLKDNLAEKVYLVYWSDKCVIENNQAYIRPDKQEDFNLLLLSLKNSSRVPQKIIHAWLTGSFQDLEKKSLFGDVNYWQRLGSGALVSLTKAISSANIVSDIKIDVLSTDLFFITGTEKNEPYKSTILPAIKVISQEYSYIKCRIIDLQEAIVKQESITMLLEDVFSEEKESIAIRWPHRWIQSYEKYKPTIIRNSSKFENIRSKVIYLVTGGVGDIGISICKMLTEKYNSKIIITLREKLPGREQWEAIIAEGKSEKLIKYLKNAITLERINADYVIYYADAGSLEEMQQVLNDVESNYGKVNGVIHCAGLPSEQWDRTIALTEQSTFEWHYQSKVYGQIVLEKLFENREVDFVILMSSLAAVLGGLRLLPYACANSYMGYAAQSININKGRQIWTALHWDVWQHHQDEKRAISDIGRMMDDKTVQHEEGISIIENIMNNPQRPSQLIISTWDLYYRIDKWLNFIYKSERDSTDNNQLLEYELGDSSDSVGGFVLGLFRKTLGNPQLGKGDDFFELGGDSLISVNLLSKIRDKYKVDISLAKFLSNPTASMLIDMVEEKMSVENLTKQIFELSEYFEYEEIADLINEVAEVNEIA